MSFYHAVSCVLYHEGGYVDHKNDPGGATNLGISLRYLQSQSIVDGDYNDDGSIDAKDIAAMTRGDAIAVYRKGFWIPNKLNKIQSDLISTKIFDMCVNMGSRQAWKLVQRSVTKLGVPLKADGIVGPATLKGINYFLSEDYLLIDEIRLKQRAFYEGLVKQKSRLSVFALGWFRRAAF